MASSKVTEGNNLLLLLSSLHLNSPRDRVLVSHLHARPVPVFLCSLLLLLLLRIARLQFRKMLNKELSHFAESSKSGTQVSKFLMTTYMDKDEDETTLEVPSLEVPPFFPNSICSSRCRRRGRPRRAAALRSCPC